MAYEWVVSGKCGKASTAWGMKGKAKGVRQGRAFNPTCIFRRNLERYRRNRNSYLWVVWEVGMAWKWVGLERAVL